MQKEIILSHLLDYLEKKKIPLKKAGKVTMVECPFCKKQPMSANLIPNTHIINCFSCKKKYNLIDIAKKLEGWETKSEDQIIHNLKEMLKIQVMTKIDEDNIEKYLDFYEKNEFDLVPIAKNSKVPIEKQWTEKEHKTKKEWKRWMANGLNLGVKTGIRSNIIIIDIDQKPIPEEVKKLMGDTLIQESTNGFHLFYKYDEDFPKTRIEDLKIDIENDGGQVVIYPSKINEIERKIKQLQSIVVMPKELKKFLLEKITVPRKTNSEKVREDIQTEEFNLGLLGEGQRNSSLVRLGGIFRKELNLNQTKYVLNTLNKTLCKNPLPYREITAMINSLEHYNVFDEKELAHQILEYLKKVEEANRTEIAMAVVGTNRGEDKKRVDLSLSYLVKEEYVIKKGRSYSVIKKAEWKESLIEIGKPIDFKMPYFYNIANFNWGDLLLIGSKNKRGKTHLAINIIKQLVEQGKKPYYLSLETGSRFTRIALQLGLKEGDFFWDFQADPTKIELEKDSITIIDWLCPLNFAETDKIFMHFVTQLYKTNGILIVFMQLKNSKAQDNEWFAPNLVSQFPALSARYIYDNEGDGEFGKFVIDVVREPKLKIKTWELPARYNWETKELKLIEEIEQEKISKKIKENEK